MSRLPKSLLTPRAAGLIGVLAFLLLGFGLFCSTGQDDSHITSWSAYSLEHFGKLTNYNGDRVEQSSSLAHVLILAALGALTRIPYPTLGPITSILGGVVALLLVVRLARLAVPDAPRGVVLVVATAESFVFWGFGGLEATIVAAAGVWVIYEGARYLEAPGGARLARAAAAMLLYVTARPESPLVLACTLGAALAHAAYRRRFDRSASLGAALRPALALAAVAAVECAALFAFRRAYFGLWFPNPVYSKVPGINLLDGLAYFGMSLFPAGLWILPGVYFGVRRAHREARTGAPPNHAVTLSAAFVVAYLSFILLVGGDWMSGGRFFAHVMPLLAIVAAAGLTHRVQSERWLQRAVAIVIAMNLGGVLLLVFSPFFVRVSNGRPLWTTRGLRAQVEARVGDRGLSWFELTNVVHLRDSLVTGLMLDLVRAVREVKGDQRVVIMSTQAGMVTYHLTQANYGAVRFIDTCSLSTRDFLECPAAAPLLDGTPYGMAMGQETFFGNQARLAACGIPRPDIVFGLSSRRDVPVLKANGYTIYYEQKGMVRGAVTAEGRSADAFKAEQYIAVDTALFANLGLKKKDRFEWNIR